MLAVTREIFDRAKQATLSSAEIARFSRHILLPQVGIEGQKRLKAARILVVGAGGLGSPALLYLAAAGVGCLGVAEFDRVDVSNLQRQILYSTADAGRAKLEAALERLRALNPGCALEAHAGPLNIDNAQAIIAKYDIVIDGSDNFATRYLVSDACVLLSKPYVYGSIYRFDGQASVFYPPHGPCYRCLFPEPPPPQSVPSCAEGGVLGVLPGQIGTLQALEAIKLVLGIGETLIKRLHLWDALAGRVSQIRLNRDPNCALCGDQPTRTSLEATAWHCAPTSPEPLCTPEELLAWQADTALRPVLLDVRSPAEASICQIDESLLIPLPELTSRLAELPRDRRLVVYCKSGMRSREAVRILRERDFADVFSLDGGILAWIAAVDQTLSIY